MDAKPSDLDCDNEVGDLGGALVVPSSKVRLPKHLTKLRKRDRRDHDADDVEQEA